MNKNFDNFISIADLWHLCVAKWHWFVISLLMCLSLALFRITQTKLTYRSNAAILVLEDKEGKGVRNKADEEFRNMTLINQNVNVNNLTKQITSLDVLTEVARRLDTVADEEKLQSRALGLRSRLVVDVAGKNTSVINLSYSDYSPEDAKRILALVIQVYNDKWASEKEHLTQSTSSFIDSRLVLIKDELDLFDDSISSFKSENMITELSKVADINLQHQQQSDIEIMQLKNQRIAALSLRDLLSDKDAPHTLLPINSGINNGQITSQISMYNNQVMQYYSHLNYTSSQNPRIVIQEKELTTLRNTILYAVENQISTLDLQIRTIENFNSKAAYNIAVNPLQAQLLTSIEREQKVKEDLYLYLLQKKEENEISSTYQRSSIKILDHPYVSGSSSSKKTKILGAAFLLGILLPTLLIYLLSMIDKSIRKRSDIERYPKLSLMGEVPEYGKKSFYFRKKILVRKPQLVVGEGRKDAVNEAFRLLRSKLLHDADNKVYMITSNGDGEGKTFVSTNLAVALAVNNQRVLFVDGDLRHGTASGLWGAKGAGLAEYLEGRGMDLSSLLFHHKDFPTLDVLPSGNMPDNPTELLSTQAFGDLIATQRDFYDIILIDTPKTENLADVEIIHEQADVTIFVIRTGKTERQILDKLEADQENGKYTHLALVMNGAKES